VNELLVTRHRRREKEVMRSILPVVIGGVSVAWACQADSAAHTSAPHYDISPLVLPDGDILFVSTRRAMWRCSVSEGIE